jgi:hypothetical protein
MQSNESPEALQKKMKKNTFDTYRAFSQLPIEFELTDLNEKRPGSPAFFRVFLSAQSTKGIASSSCIFTPVLIYSST